MCAVTLALAVVSAACPPVSLQLSEAKPAAVSRRLSNPELDQIRGGQGYVAKAGRNGLVRLVQDGNVRDMNFVLSSASQPMDAWWSDVGSAYVALSLSRP